MDDRPSGPKKQETSPSMDCWKPTRFSGWVIHKLVGMEPIELLRTSVYKTMNHPDLTDVIIRIFEAAGDDTEIAMRSNGNFVGYEFAEFIMQLADIAFDRDPALCVDPSYNDATVETKARHKHPAGCFVQPIIAQGNPAKTMRDEQQSTTHGPKTREFGATLTHS